MDLNWHQQRGSSLLWALARGTAWGRQFWRLAWPYLTPRRSWRPLGSLALQLLLTLAAVRMTVLFSYWYKGFYDALQALNSAAFWTMLGIFGVLATVH